MLANTTNPLSYLKIFGAKIRKFLICCTLKYGKALCFMIV